MNVRRIYPNVKFNHYINNLSFDSRKVNNNDIFYAIKGEKNDGNDFIEEAIYNGAKTIVYEKEIKRKHQNINYVLVNNIKKQLAMDAKIFYHNISKKMKLIGVTGTNGKTTTTTLVYKTLRYLKKNVCLIGSNGCYINDDYYEINNTTPSIIEIYNFLSLARKKGSKIVVMEVSSHAIKLMRIYGLSFYLTLFTNITQDHLDFHHNFTDYLYTKVLFMIKQNNNIIVNSDSPYFSLIDSYANGKVITYGKMSNNYKIEEVDEGINESKFILRINNQKVYNIKTKILAEFNIYNLVSALAILDKLKLLNLKVINFLSNNIKVDGRMEFFEKNNIKVIVDFAHTPDGIKNVLAFLNKVKKNNIITVLGCGGDRDKDKRHIMGKIASELSDFVLFTIDNPRSEEPQSIINDIIKGCHKKNYSIVLNRKEAIKIAIDMAKEKDIVAILGKGNEKYIIVKDEKIPFNDIEEVKKCLGVTNE